ncbi:DUF1819 family protein [Corynebacterium glutamicum]|uniref:DUF1819 family protein n=1 Tax=Corynebacterium glutamicum TaxID=1718 RepID=UPI001C6EA7F8|nr:DUF1819 family protein [Corynebacterium glutamicum]QYR17128.1 DUF1819 family protein [Corynebacterium glutamicum]
MPENGNDRYALSFTTGGLLAREAATLTPLYLQHHNWEKVRESALDNNLLQVRTYSSGVRHVRETIKRLKFLSQDEIEILGDLTSSELNHMMWAAVCRCYQFIGEFAEEVLRERFLILANTVTYEEYDSFYRSKLIWHDELDEVTSMSYKKLRQVLFKMMFEAELITPEGSIEPVLISSRVRKHFLDHNPSDIRFFPTKESQ